MDQYDKKILRFLQKQPSLTNSELAKLVGLSETPCWRRVKRMETDGVIAGRLVQLDPEKLGFSVNVIAEFTLSNHDEDTLSLFERAVQDHDEIVACFSMSGTSDYLLRVVARNIADYEAFLKRVLLHLPGVASVNSRFALKALKISQNIPI